MRSHRRPPAWRVLVVALLPALAAGAAVPPPPAAAEGDGRGAADLELERFLLAAEVVGDEPVGEGVTGSRRLTLRLAGVERRAIFKTVDLEADGAVRTNRVEVGFRDCYRFEVAAYRLDRALGVGLVPVTVVRELGGEEGSLQAWVEDAVSLRRALAAPTPAAAGDFELLARRLTLMYLLDALIGNVDRNHDNILVNPAADRFALVDHSRSFRTGHAVAEPRGFAPVPLPAEVASRLLALDRDRVEAVAGELLSPVQVRALLARRDRLAEVLQARGAMPG